MKEFSQIFNFTIENGKKYSSNLVIYKNFEELQPIFKEVGYILSKDELKKYNDINAIKRKKSFLMGRYAAKRSLQNSCNIKNLHEVHIENAVFGFPVIYHKNITNTKISIAHSNNIGAAISYNEEFPIAIDIEEINNKRSEVIEKNLTNNEKNLFSKLEISEEVRNFIIWTAKESLSKILKTGLTLDLEIMEISKVEEVNKDEFICFFKNFGQYKARSIKGGNFIYSLVVPKYSSTTSYL